MAAFDIHLRLTIELPAAVETALLAIAARFAPAVAPPPVAYTEPQISDRVWDAFWARPAAAGQAASEKLEVEAAVLAPEPALQDELVAATEAETIVAPRPAAQGLLFFPPEREAALRLYWPQGMPRGELLPILEALPGRPGLTGKHVTDQANRLGLARPVGFRAQPVRDAEAVGAVVAPGAAELPWFPPERVETLRQYWPTAMSSHDIVAMMEALPGRPGLTRKLVNDKAQDLRLRRPNTALTPRKMASSSGDFYGSRPKVWTEARCAVLRRDWPAGRAAQAIFDEVAALPGAPISSPGSVSVQAATLKLRRPASHWPAPSMKEVGGGLVSAEIVETGPLPSLAPAVAPPVAPISDLKAGLVSEAIAEVRPARAVAEPVAPVDRVFRAPRDGRATFGSLPYGRAAAKPVAKRVSPAEEAAIAAHIAAKGVTKCPAAALEVTTAVMSPDDRKVIAEYTARQEAARLEKNPSRSTNAARSKRAAVLAQVSEAAQRARQGAAA